jgi:hypothetical protein
LRWSTRWWGVECQVLESKVYKFEICKAWFLFPNLAIQILQLARQLKIKWLKPSNFNNPHCITTLKQNRRSKRKKLETYLENWTLALYNIELNKLHKLETTPILKWCKPLLITPHQLHAHHISPQINHKLSKSMQLCQRNIKRFMKIWFHNLNSKTFATLANLKQVIPKWLICGNHKCNMRIIMHIIVLVTSRWPYVLMLANWVA